jgi:tRNA dimethylallyltransferase
MEPGVTHDGVRATDRALPAVNGDLEPAGRLIVIAGPTGTGKSDLGLDLAERLGGEVVNADSMQLYRGMDVGTAKMPPDQRRGIPHHLLDVLDVTQTASVAAYQRQARAMVEGIRARGHVAIVVGGSGLYIQAIVDDIDFPATDPRVRSRLQAELDALGADALFRRLQAADPTAAAVIEPANGRRIARALEVIEITGRPFTASLPVPGPARYGALLVRLDRESAELDARLERRVRAMVDGGFLDEVRALDFAGIRQGLTASRALGYRQMLAVLDGTLALERAIVETTAATRRFVRRQRSWFRRDSRMVDIDAAVPGTADRVLDLLGGR